MAEAYDKESVRRSAKANDLTLNYYEAGSPTGVGGDLPLLMLHGGGPGASAWSNFGSALPRFASSFRMNGVSLSLRTTPPSLFSCAPQAI